MRAFLLIATLAGATLLGACTEPETYPVSGEPCGPDDPVKSLDASDCAPIRTARTPVQPARTRGPAGWRVLDVGKDRTPTALRNRPVIRRVPAANAPILLHFRHNFPVIGGDSQRAELWTKR